MDRVSQFPQYIDRHKHVLPSTVELPDLKANDELSLVDCLRQVNPAVVVDRAEQALGGLVGILAVGGILEREERKMAIRRQPKPSSNAIAAAASSAQAMWFRMRWRRSSRPCARSKNQSLRARNRRPKGIVHSL